MSTVFDFDEKCKDAYGKSFDELLDRFLDFTRNYKPAEGELDYYASMYFDRGDMSEAKKYYGELVALGQGNINANRKKLAASEFWLGEYAAADSIYDMLLNEPGESPTF